ncbi:MAG: TetR/AcrR family transcriptional regulator [Bacteroidales bacterium]|nr:TetR/AcrR family transcriptional regulator [Bacteroidales bacterium]MBN2819858.1 TetR/AcrR family transcriptional regulator [Bacteroidales bacterium]
MPEIDVKDLIVDSATKFFSKYGFHKTTMDEIAKNIHKAKGVIYYYFRSKEELFREVLKKELDNVKTELSKIISSNEDYMTIIKQYFLTRLKLLSTAVNYHETLKADFFEKYNFVKDVRDDFAAYEYKQLLWLFTKGEKDGHLTINNMKSTVNVVMMLLSSIEFPLYLQNKYSEYESTIDELVTMITVSLRGMQK